MTATRPSAPERFRAAYPRALAVATGISVAAHVVLAILAGGIGIRLPEPSGPLAAPRVVLLAPAPPDAPPAVQIAPPSTPILRPPAPAAEPVAVPEAPELEVPEPVYIPHDVPPRLVNLDQVLSALRDGYPQGLPEEAGRSVVILWLFVDVAGRVTHIRLRQSSGYDPLDDLAQQVAPLMAYRPALHLSEPVGVWVQQQIRFEPPSSSLGPPSESGRVPGV